MRRIVRENLLTLVNAIALGFLILIAIAGAWNDAIFAAVIAVNAMIGIGQELSAKRKLDQIALLVAPAPGYAATASSSTSRPRTSCPTTSSSCSPATRSWPTASWRRASSLALDESMLTGESDQVPKEPGDPVLSGAYCAGGPACTACRRSAPTRTPRS